MNHGFFQNQSEFRIVINLLDSLVLGTRKEAIFTIEALNEYLPSGPLKISIQEILSHVDLGPEMCTISLDDFDVFFVHWDVSEEDEEELDPPWETGAPNVVFIPKNELKEDETIEDYLSDRFDWLVQSVLQYEGPGQYEEED